MTNIEPFLRLLLRFESSITCDSDNYSDLRCAFEDNRERLFVNDPRDRGGATLCGVTLTTLHRYMREFYGQQDVSHVDAAELRALTFDEWVAIVRRYSWDALRCGFFERQKLAVCVADYAFNSGPRRAATALQRCLNCLNGQQNDLTVKSPSGARQTAVLAEDGFVGPLTLKWMRQLITTAAREEVIIQAYSERRAAFIEQCVAAGGINPAFRRGLLARVNYILTLPRRKG